MTYSRSPISVVATIYNEEKSIDLLLLSISSQTIKPMELIIVDGGSSDATVDIIKSFQLLGNDYVELIIDPTCNNKNSASPIARGRNVGIQNSKSEIIAITDASTKLANDWLEKITQPLFKEVADCVGGNYEVFSGNRFWGKYYAMLHQPSEREFHLFIPSSRSIAFRKSIWKKVGGYPEGFKYGEDTEFFLRIKQSGARIINLPDAKSIWYPNGTDSWKGGMKLIYNYAKGNGQRNIFIWHSLKLLLFYFSFPFLLTGGFVRTSSIIVDQASSLFIFLWLILLLARAYKIYTNHSNKLKIRFDPVFVFYLCSYDITSILGFFSGELERLIKK